MLIGCSVLEALLVVDVQNDFCSGGSLPVPEGELIVPLANRLLVRSAIRVLTADWHPPSHASFAASQPGTSPFDQGVVGGITQTLWPVHCVQGSHGAAFHPQLVSNLADLILRKGIRPELDSYSAFYENDRQTSTGLDGYLRGRGVDAVAIVCLALDHCVAWSSEDAVPLTVGDRWSALWLQCARPVWPWKLGWNWVERPPGDSASQRANNRDSIYETGIMQEQSFRFLTTMRPNYLHMG